MYVFGDSFDLYATVTDISAGYWDSGGANGTLVAGRFAGSQCINLPSSGFTPIVKTSGANDAVHHIVCAYRQTAALSGTTLGSYLGFADGVTGQVYIVFRSDGAILLASGSPAGTVLATYSGAVTAANTWYAFEFEVIINNTTGRFRVRKNGNTSDDFDSGATLNTRPGTNNYANKFAIGMNATVNAQQFDDVLWRSDPSSVPWVGDVRAYVRMPASDVSVQFTRLGGATNASQVSEAHQDGTTTYVYDSNVGDADLYAIAALSPSPASVVAVTTRGFVAKSDAGTRGAAVQLKSGGTTVGSTATALNTSFGWLWRTDVTDPATGSAWTPSAVNAATIGPKVTS